MRRGVPAWLLLRRGSVLGLAVLVAGTAALPAASATEADATGARLYRARCASCHGAAGRGDGPDAELYDPRPRDLGAGFLDRYDTDDLMRRVREGWPLQLVLDLYALRARAEETEAIAVHLQRLPDADWRSLDVGQEIFIDRCEICHGPFGRGRADLPAGVARPRDLGDPGFQRAITDEELERVVRHGREGMPAIVPPVPESETAVLAAFVRSLSPGFELYSRHCSACHGADGRGAGSFAETVQRPTVAFDRAYFRRRDPDEIRAAIWHMLGDQKPAMPHMAEVLEGTEARAIIEYLKAVQPARDPEAR